MFSFNKRKSQFLVLIVLMVFFAGCQTPAGRSAGQVIDDSTITTKVKAQILADKEVDGIAISVSTFSGEVTLTGTTETYDLKDKAERIVTSVVGVRKVNNLLKVKNIIRTK